VGGGRYKERVQEGPDRQSAWSAFRRDLVIALRVWKAAPLLPLLALGIAATSMGVNAFVRERTIGEDPSWWFMLLLAPALVFAGWPGTERIWYLRFFRGNSLALRELVSFTIAFWWPFLSLGILVSLVLLPFFAIFSILEMPWWLQTSFFVPVDVLMTFITPALAFTTRSVTNAIRIGLRMLRDEWPRDAWYALVPPLAALFVVQTLPRSLIGTSWRIALVFSATLLNLWFKGATAAFYLRRHDVGDFGSVLRRGSKTLPNDSKSNRDAGVRPC
jgi:hypothetical protein